MLTRGFFSENVFCCSLISVCHLEEVLSLLTLMYFLKISGPQQDWTGKEDWFSWPLFEHLAGLLDWKGDLLQLAGRTHQSFLA
jgi:hypothetical protein